MNLLRCGFALACLAFVCGTAVADDKAGTLEKFTYRVQGLFAPDREADLRDVIKEFPDVTLVSIGYESAELTVVFNPKKLFPDAKPDQVLERFNQKVRNATKGTFSVVPRRTTPRDQLEQVTVRVAPLDCKACALGAYEIVVRVEGVEQATVDMKEGQISALIDPKKTDRAKLEEALRKREIKVIKQ
jgi:copper chaperone CopZ